MPLKKCQKNGKQGWKWGDEGECYIGPSGKNKATRQGIAIEISKGNYTNQPSQISAVRDNYQETYKDYPKAASDNAKKALEWIYNPSSLLHIKRPSPCCVLYTLRFWKPLHLPFPILLTRQCTHGKISALSTT